jgi:uncharacterized protein YbjT (DUF2867 family)
VNRALVVGASGEVGREVLRALHDRGAVARALVRVTRPAGGEHVAGDLGVRASLDRALDGCDVAVFVTPHHAREEQLGHNFIDACEAAGIRRLVYVSAFHPLSRSRIVQRLFDGLIGLIGAHYKAKLRVERRVRASRMSPVVLCPSNFFQNDELCLPEILDGRYPQPLGGRAVSRVDTRDIGDAVARAVLDDVPPGAYPLVGPGAWTGPECARVWSDALGMDVRYAGDDIDAWRMTVGARMPEARAADFARTYRVIQRFGVRSGQHARATTEWLLGAAPRDYRAYVAERVGRFTARAAG